VGLSPAEPIVVALHRVVGAGPGPGNAVVGGGAGAVTAISPPFLDFIESSGVTTQWSSLVEMLRGTDGWTPFVAPTATAGAPLVTGSAAILGTCLVAAAGLAGLASRICRRGDDWSRCC